VPWARSRAGRMLVEINDGAQNRALLPSPVECGVDCGATVAGARTTVMFRACGDQDVEEPRVLSVSLTFEQLRGHAVVCAFPLSPCDDFGGKAFLCCRPPPPSPSPDGLLVFPF
jgi:hypothetical protein